MASLTIRDLDDSIKLKLRVRAAAQNRSMEEEARQILRAALQDDAGTAGPAFAARVRNRFAGLGDVVLQIEPREPVRLPLELHEPSTAYDANPEGRRERAAGTAPAASAKASAPTSASRRKKASP